MGPQIPLKSRKQLSAKPVVSPVYKPTIQKVTPTIIKPIHKKETKKEISKEYYVSDEYGNYWCGYRKGSLFWSDQISIAREVEQESHFDALVRWEKGRKLKKEYL